METQKINGIVLSASKYKDYDALCSILTENGIKKVKFTGVRRPKAKLAFAAQPFCCGEFLLSGANDYAVVMQASQTEDFYSLASNYDAFVFGAQMLKIAGKIATNDSKELLELLLVCLSTLLVPEIDLIVVENYFYTRILQLLGVWGDFSCCTVCGKKIENGAIVSADSGALFCKNCAPDDGVAISSNVFEHLNFCANNSLSKIVANQPTDGVKNKANEILLKIVSSQT